jgi:hypothetical protein
MQLILALPALFEESDDTAGSTRAPALSHVMALAGTPKRQAGGLDAALAAHYGVERQNDWPLAPIRLAALGIEPGDGYWLVADAVTVEVGLASAELVGVVNDLDRMETDALLATLNAHFASDELAFVAPRPGRIFVRAAAATRLSTIAASAALRRPLRPLLPQGQDAATWRRWQSEIEMLLHEHPVNVERERASRAQVNAFWFSQGGTLAPLRLPPTRIATFAANGIARALAAFTGSPAQPLPDDFRDALRAAGPADSIVAAPDEATEIASIERAWAAPARAALAAGSLNSVQILAESEGDAVIWHAGRPRLWQRIAGRFQTRDLRTLLDAARQVT